jgi:hypothetical protein
MKVIVANKDDYIRFNARLLNKLNTFELTGDTEDYIIHRVKLGKDTQDVSLMDSCINNLLDEQYEKREYIKLEEIQAINDLILNLNKDECHILNAYAEVNRYNVKNLNEIEELISNINDYQILEKYNLHELGLLIAEKVPGYKMDINVIPFMNFAKLAENYLFDANIKEQFCSYGLLVNTREMLDNELIQPKLEDDKVLKIEVVNKKEFEESSMYSKVTIYLPTTKERLEEKFKLINLDYNKLTIQDTHITKCEIVNFYDEILATRFNKVMEYQIEKYFKNSYTTPFHEIELLCNEVKNFDNIRMQKFLAIEEIKDNKINYIHDLVNCAKQTSKYNLLPNVNDFFDMGKYLVNETGHFDDVSLLEDYIDYYKLAKDYTQKGCTYNGKFTEYGYLMEKEFIEKENKEESENEEEFE